MARYKFFHLHHGSLVQALFFILEVGFNVIKSTEYKCCLLFKVTLSNN